MHICKVVTWSSCRSNTSVQICSFTVVLPTSHKLIVVLHVKSTHALHEAHMYSYQVMYTTLKVHFEEKFYTHT